MNRSVRGGVVNANPLGNRTLMPLIRFGQMRDADPLFPRTFLGRLQLAAESLFVLGGGIYLVFNWPPVGVAAQGLWVDIFLAIVFEMMVAVIPLACLGLWWAMATPEWIRTFLKRAFHHVGIVVFVLVMFGLLGMIAGTLGWW